MASADTAWASATAPVAAPTHFFEMTFDAPAGVTYRVWLRMRARDNSKWNDAVWVQFSDATFSSGVAAYQIGTTTGLMVNLERCSGCGTSGWGWMNSVYWLKQATDIRFAASGQHTIRVQTREDGVEIDQIVLSPVTYVTTPPGPMMDDSTVVPKPEPPPSLSVELATTPFKDVPFALPGTVDAADFDNGSQGVAYSDSSLGNAGNTYRKTSDVDIQSASGGGYNVGWTTPGEWLKYSVNVASAATYTVELRVAATNAQSVEVTIGSASVTLAVPSTGNWQAWTTVGVPMTLAAGPQTMTVRFPAGGVNLRSVSVVPQPVPPVQPPDGGAPTGGTIRVMTWNIHQGRTKAGAYDPLSQAKFIVSQNPDVVLLQEINTTTENQPVRFKAMLEQLTGQTWFVQWAPIMDSRRNEGNMVLTRLPVTSSTYHQMHATGDWTAMYSNRSIAQATVLVGGVPVDVFSTHLDYYNTAHRTAQLLDMMAWAETFSPRRIIGGDFNSWWGEYWIVTMMADYYDTWQEVKKTNHNGYTVNNAVRFDYLFRSKESSSNVTPLTVAAPVTNLSDHNPVLASYRITP